MRVWEYLDSRGSADVNIYTAMFEQVSSKMAEFYEWRISIVPSHNSMSYSP